MQGVEDRHREVRAEDGKRVTIFGGEGGKTGSGQGCYAQARTDLWSTTCLSISSTCTCCSVVKVANADKICDGDAWISRTSDEWYTNVNSPIRNWQSMRSRKPPWPGSELPKSLMPAARLKPDAKKPPKGATSDANAARTIECSWNGAYGIAVMCLRVCARSSAPRGNLETSQARKKKETYDLLEKRGDRSRDRKPVPLKDVVRLTLDVAKHARRQVLDGADHVVEPHKERSPLRPSHPIVSPNFTLAASLKGKEGGRTK